MYSSIIFLILGALASSCLAQDHSVCCAESTTSGYTSVLSISDTTTEDCTSHAGELYWVHTGDGYCRLLTDLACEEIYLSDLGIDGSAYECDLAESSAANDVVQAYLGTFHHCRCRDKRTSPTAFAVQSHLATVIFTNTFYFDSIHCQSWEELRWRDTTDTTLSAKSPMAAGLFPGSPLMGRFVAHHAKLGANGLACK